MAQALPLTKLRRTLPRVRELKLKTHHHPQSSPNCRTLPRVRELKLEHVVDIVDKKLGRTLPRVRELKLI